MTTTTLRDDFLAALLAADATRARGLIDQAVDGGMPVRDVYLEVLAPTLEEVGDRWAAGELHALGAQMVADFLEGEGWEVLALGASTPAPDLAALVDYERPDLVALSTAVADNLGAAVTAVQMLRGLDDPPFIAAGGRAWAAPGRERRSAMGADAVFADPRSLCDLVAERFPPVED